MGGAENILASLADGLERKGCQVKIICLKGPIVVKPTSPNIEIVDLEFNGIKNLGTAFKKIKSICQEFQPDVIHAHMFHAIILARLSKFFYAIPKLICTAHSKAYGGFNRALLYKITDHFSDINTNVSYEATDFFIKNKVFKRHNTVTVTNGVDTQKFISNFSQREKYRKEFNLSGNDKIFIAVGRFNQAKDYPNLITAFQKVSQMQTVKLFIVGDGELRAQIENLIDDYQLNDKVILLGIRRDITDLLNMADYFILSSAWEGLPTVLMEAMATEKIVITTDCGGAREIVNNQEYLVPTKDSDALTQKMLEVIEINQQDCEQIGKINRQRVIDHYSLDAMVGQWLKLYKS